MANSSVETNYFDGLREWDALKCFFIAFHIIITFIGPALLYCVIWYENYGCDARYRTVVNILLSHSCWINLTRCIVERIPHVIMMILAPHSSRVCDGFLFLARFDHLCLMSELLLWQAIRYIYIFHWKNVATLDDQFIACFLTTTNLLMCVVFTFVTYMKGFHNVNEEFHICTGKNPVLNFNQTPFLQLSVSSSPNPVELLNKIDPLWTLNTLILVLLFIVTFRTWVYSRKDEFAKLLRRPVIINQVAPLNQASIHSSEHQNPNFWQITKTSLIGASGSLVAVISLVLLILPAITARGIFTKNADKINYGHGCIIYYICCL